MLKCSTRRLFLVWENISSSIVCLFLFDSYDQIPKVVITAYLDNDWYHCELIVCSSNYRDQPNLAHFSLLWLSHSLTERPNDNQLVASIHSLTPRPGHTQVCSIIWFCKNSNNINVATHKKMKREHSILALALTESVFDRPSFVVMSSVVWSRFLVTMSRQKLEWKSMPKVMEDRRKF